MTDVDVCIVGGGAMGSSTAYYLSSASPSTSVLLLEKGELGGHKEGSSHGKSRITRRSDGSPFLEDLATASLVEWELLQEKCSEQLFKRCGSLDLGDPKRRDFEKLLQRYRNTPDFEVLTSKQIKKKWGAFLGIPDSWYGIYNSEGGILSPDVAVPLLQSLAKSNGATLRGNSTVVRIDRREKYSDIYLENGEKVRARRVVVAAGPWTSELLLKSFQIELPIDIWEITFGWYKVKEQKKRIAKSLPVWRLFGEELCYGFPINENEEAIKIAPYGRSDMNVYLNPDRRSHKPSKQYIDNVSKYSKSVFAAMLDDNVDLETSTCLYSVTRDGEFVISWLDKELDVLILAGFNGSGFKHVPIVGKIVSEMVSAAMSGDTEIAQHPAAFPSVSAFSIKREGLYGEHSSKYSNL